MSIQTVLSSGFLLLAGIMILDTGVLGEFGGWLALVFLPLGSVPLLWCLLRPLFCYKLPPSDTTHSTHEED